VSFNSEAITAGEDQIGWQEVYDLLEKTLKELPGGALLSLRPIPSNRGKIHVAYGFAAQAVKVGIDRSGAVQILRSLRSVTLAGHQSPWLPVQVEGG
jgi:hypothetical protein